MLSLRVWIITALIVLSAMGAYLWWARRARVTYTSRSLSAANPANKPQTRTLHVEGCHDDFTVKVGELVEPRAIPGSPIEDFRKTYGPETTHDKSGLLTWDQNAYTLITDQKEFVQISLKQGHVLQTLDSIELGIDSFGTIFRKMRDRGIEAHERITQTPEGWTLTMTFYSNCSKNYRSEYSRTLPSTPELVKQITPSSTNPDGTPVQDPSLYRSDVFMNKIVSEYKLVPSQGHDDSVQGLPASHL